MGKVDRLRKRVETLGYLHGLGSRHLASLHRRTQSKSLDGRIVGSSLNNNALSPPLFPIEVYYFSIGVTK